MENDKVFDEGSVGDSSPSSVNASAVPKPTVCWLLES